MWYVFHGQIFFFNELIIIEKCLPFADCTCCSLRCCYAGASVEMFTGKGDIKEDTELTKAERKRRELTRKRKLKV